MPYDSAIEVQEKEEEDWGDICGCGICILKQVLYLLRPCFPGSCWASACQWGVVNEFLFFFSFFFLHSCAAFVFPFKLSLSWPVSLLTFLLVSLHPAGMGSE